MNLLSWNCCGLGNPRVVRALGLLIRQKGPNVVFICETKLSYEEWDELKRKIGFPNHFAVSSVGRSGGLGLLWDHDTSISLQSHSKYHIDDIDLMVEDRTMGIGGLLVSMVTQKRI
ncbi:hypothetical protein L6164_004704 [Bauhinia variegata]|uniref:Uncharacterized protein n=1 Tax=Bauhinia variegata TaxID=167791 RepID=A0ACB9PP26_BAUVA|nr:hypothetical protein L6164_004704 [Bauhinia variegata]